MTLPPHGTYTPANWGEVITHLRQHGPKCVLFFDDGYNPGRWVPTRNTEYNFRNNIETYRLSQYVLVKVRDPEEIIAELKELHRSLDDAT